MKSGIIIFKKCRRLSPLYQMQMQIQIQMQMRLRMQEEFLNVQLEES